MTAFSIFILVLAHPLTQLSCQTFFFVIRMGALSPKSVRQVEQGIFRKVMECRLLISTMTVRKIYSKTSAGPYPGTNTPLSWLQTRDTVITGSQTIGLELRAIGPQAARRSNKHSRGLARNRQSDIA